MSRAGLRRPIQPPPLRSPKRGRRPGYPRSNGGLHGAWCVAEGADQATVKRLNDGVAEASQNARAVGHRRGDRQARGHIESRQGVRARPDEADGGAAAVTRRGGQDARAARPLRLGCQRLSSWNATHVRTVMSCWQLVVAGHFRVLGIRAGGQPDELSAQFPYSVPTRNGHRGQPLSSRRRPST